jgi:hypothetical protein
MRKEGVDGMSDAAVQEVIHVMRVRERRSDVFGQKLTVRVLLSFFFVVSGG